MTLDNEKTVAQLVTENIKTAHVFKKYGIDFCCGGGISVRKACEKKGVDFSLLKKELSEVDQETTGATNYDAWDLSFLTDHIINVHHTYVEESIPILLQYADKVARIHGRHHTEVVRINELITEAANELSTHLKKEEHVLFPYIKHLGLLEKDGKQADQPPFGKVKNPIMAMEDDHQHVGDIFKEIARLTNQYTPPEGACNTFRALYAKLDEFEQDLHHHIHLENNILFPKAQQLEAKHAHLSKQKKSM